MFALVFLTVFFTAWIVLMWVLHHALTPDDAKCIAELAPRAANRDVSAERQTLNHNT